MIENQQKQTNSQITQSKQPGISPKQTKNQKTKIKEVED